MARVVFVRIGELQEQAWRTALYPWEHEFARQVGIGRTNQNLSKSDRHSYDPSKLMADNEIANIHSAAAEIGAFRLIGGYCYNGIWLQQDHEKYKELPDGLLKTTEVEVKWRRSAHKMPVDRKDANRNRLVLWVESRLAHCQCEVCCDTPPRDKSRVRLLGGGWAAELWNLGTSYNGDPNRVGVPADKLIPISLLLSRD
jgi:hypothetical protein